MKEKYHIIALYSLFIAVITLLISISHHTQQKQKSLMHQYLTVEEISYVQKNRIPFSELLPYLMYDNFVVYNYRSYEQIRQAYDLSHLESINLFHNPDYYSFYKNPKPALFPETPLTLVNKCYYLEKDFVPENLVKIDNYQLPHYDRPGDEIYLKKEVMENLALMIKDAAEEGLHLVVYSGYRSYQKQIYLYNDVYQKNDTISARPGFSEHQSGYAVDIATAASGLTYNFENTAVYHWLIANAHRYGFILRYPKNKKMITGYEFEPWHFRFVGAYSEAIFRQNLTLEEFILANFQI
ncbi:MAG: M15 family metallopeptidase [Acholeplasmataceae bacterium]|nr:M15 family metallopeptidase [Acholeplasmataceae bacterium]